MNTETVAVPGDPTIQLQPLDAPNNKPLWNHMRGEWNKLMVTPKHNATATKLRKRRTISDVSTRAKEWNHSHIYVAL